MPGSRGRLTPDTSSSRAVCCAQAGGQGAARVPNVCRTSRRAARVEPPRVMRLVRPSRRSHAGFSSCRCVSRCLVCFSWRGLSRRRSRVRVRRSRHYVSVPVRESAKPHEAARPSHSSPPQGYATRLGRARAGGAGWRVLGPGRGPGRRPTATRMSCSLARVRALLPACGDSGR